MSEQYEMDQNQDSSGQDQTEGGGGESTGEENNEADMIFPPEASKPGATRECSCRLCVDRRGP